MQKILYNLPCSKCLSRRGGARDAEDQGTCYSNAAVIGGSHFHRDRYEVFPLQPQFGQEFCAGQA